MPLTQPKTDLPFKNLLNDSYCRDISIKVRSQLDIKRRKGEFIGGYAMYGYCKDERNKSRLVVDEYAADVVRSIYRRKLEGIRRMEKKRLTRLHL